jgi:hypothetical protein
MGRVFLAPFVWGLIGLAWLLVTLMVFTPPQDLRLRRLAPWLAVPALAICTFVVSTTELPLRVRLELSRGTLEEVARDVAAGRREPPEDGRLGLYTVYMAHRTQGNGFAFLIEDTGFIDPCGFAYSEGGEPVPEGADVVWHVTGPWYGWCWDF